MIDLRTGVVLFCALTGLFFLFIWLWYDRRDHATFDAECRRTTFHCIRCDHLYSDRQGAQVSVCPRCGHETARLKF